MFRGNIDEIEEEKINEAYARAAERASGIIPMREDPEYLKHMAKDSGEAKKIQAEHSIKK